MCAIADGAVGKVNRADPLSERDIEQLHEVRKAGHVWDSVFAELKLVGYRRLKHFMILPWPPKLRFRALLDFSKGL